MAGIKSRFVKSPPAPKITKVHGGAWCAGVCVCRRLLLSTTRASMVGLLPQGFCDSTGEPGETGIEVAGDVRPQGTATAFGENVEIAARLRRLDDAKGIGLSGHRQVLGVVAGDLQKDTAVRSTLVGLSRRMLEARPEADAGRGRGPIADGAADMLHYIDIGLASLDIGEQGCVIPLTDPPELGLQGSSQARCLRLQCGLVARICE